MDANNKKYMVCCANGAGSSLMMKMTLQKVFTKNNINPREIHHCAISEGKSASLNYDVVFCAQNFLNTFTDAKNKGVLVIGLTNIMSPAEMEDKMKEAGLL